MLVQKSTKYHCFIFYKIFVSFILDDRRDLTPHEISRTKSMVVHSKEEGEVRNQVQDFVQKESSLWLCKRVAK